MHSTPDIQAFNWSKAADYVGKLTTVLLIGLPLMGLFFPGGNIGLDLYTIFAGFLLASIELPVIYVCIPVCGRFRSMAVETVFFTNGILRCGLYVVISILTFGGGFFTVFPGVFLLLTGIFYAGGWIVGRYEERENAASTSYNPVPGERVPISGSSGSSNQPSPGLWGQGAAKPAAGSGFDF
jgi:hypothetical protein